MKDINFLKIESIEIPQILDDLAIYQQEHHLMVYDSATDTKRTIHNRPFRSEHFSVIIVRKGNFRLKVNLAEHEMSENSLVVIAPPLIRHVIFDGHVEFYALLFTPQYLFDKGFYHKHLKLFPPFNDNFQAHLILETEQTLFLYQLIGLLKERIEKKTVFSSDFNITNLLFQSVILQIGEYYGDSVQKTTTVSENDLVARFIALLSKYFKEHREVNFYAEKLFVNPKYLTQVLTKNYKKSAREYIVEMVIMEAKSLLNKPKFSIGQIAEELHFANQFHFSRFFKKYTGVTPSDYRNSEI